MFHGKSLCLRSERKRNETRTTTILIRVGIRVRGWASEKKTSEETKKCLIEGKSHKKQIICLENEVFGEGRKKFIGLFIFAQKVVSVFRVP